MSAENRDDKSADSGVEINVDESLGEAAGAKCLAYDIDDYLRPLPDSSHVGLTRLTPEGFRRASFNTIQLESDLHSGTRSRSASRSRSVSVSRVKQSVLIKDASPEDVPDDDGVTADQAPDGGYGWLVVLASFLCNFTVDGICYTFGLFLPHFMEEFGSGKAVTAFAGSLMSGCYMTAGLFVAGLVNTYGCRPVAIVGAVAAASSLALSTLMPSVYLLILTYGLITGIFFGFVYLPSIVSVGFYFTTRRALATGIAVCGSGMGAFAFAPLVSGLLERYSWKTSLQILAGLMLLGVFYGGLMKPLKTSDPEGSKGSDKPRRKSDKEENSSERLLDVSILRLPVMGLLSLANIFGMTGYYIPYVYIASYATENVRMPSGRLATTAEAALGLAAIGISNVAGRLVFGFLSDRAAGKRIFGIRISALLINNCCLLLTGVATLTMPLLRTFPSLLASCVAFGFFISCYMSLTSIILVDLLGLERLSTAFGVIIFFRGLSSIAGPPLAGALYELTRSYEGVFAAAGALILASALTHFAVHRFEPKTHCTSSN